MKNCTALQLLWYMVATTTDAFSMSCIVSFISFRNCTMWMPSLRHWGNLWISHSWWLHRLLFKDIGNWPSLFCGPSSFISRYIHFIRLTNDSAMIDDTKCNAFIVNLLPCSFMCHGLSCKYYPQIFHSSFICCNAMYRLNCSWTLRNWEKRLNSWRGKSNIQLLVQISVNVVPRWRRAFSSKAPPSVCCCSGAKLYVPYMVLRWACNELCGNCISLNNLYLPCIYQVCSRKFSRASLLFTDLSLNLESN